MRNRYAIFPGQNQVEIRTEDLPDQAAPGQVLVRSECTFISAGTELAILTGLETQAFQKGTWCAYPWRPGYAQVGRIQSVGTGVTGWKTGERVFALGKHADLSAHGAGDLLVAVPDALDPVEAVASRMAGVALSAIVAKPPEWFPHAWVVVIGLGMVGNLAAQGYRALGARVIGIDPVESRRRLAEACGIRHTVAGGPGAADAIKAITGGELPHIVVEATGVSAVLPQAIALAGNHGHIVLLGSPRAPLTGDITALFGAIHLRNLTVHGALEWSLPVERPRSMWGVETRPIRALADKQRMIFGWILDGRMQIRPLISHVLKADSIAQGYFGLRDQPAAFTGVAIDWT